MGTSQYDYDAGLRNIPEGFRCYCGDKADSNHSSDHKPSWLAPYDESDFPLELVKANTKRLRVALWEEE